MPPKIPTNIGDGVPHQFDSVDPSIQIAVEGIDDPAIVRQIEDAVRDVIRRAEVRGRWVVAIAPSETSGRWDVGLKGPTGRHFMSFSAALDRVAAVATQHLRRRLASVS